MAAGRKNHRRHIDSSPVRGRVSVSHLQRITWLAVSTVSLYHSLHTSLSAVNIQPLSAFFNVPKT